MRVEKSKKSKKLKTRPKTSPIDKFAADFENNVFSLNKDNMSVYYYYIYKYEIFDNITNYLISKRNSDFCYHFENIRRIEILNRQETTIQ